MLTGATRYFFACGRITQTGSYTNEKDVRIISLPDIFNPRKDTKSEISRLCVFAWKMPGSAPYHINAYTLPGMKVSKAISNMPANTTQRTPDGRLTV